MPWPRFLVLSNRFILYRLLVTIDIGFNFPMIGAFLSIKIFISGDIIPDKNDKNNVAEIENITLTPGFCLLDDPMNRPKEIPNIFPNKINILLYHMFLSKSNFNTN